MRVKSPLSQGLAKHLAERFNHQTMTLYEWLVVRVESPYTNQLLILSHSSAEAPSKMTRKRTFRILEVQNGVRIEYGLFGRGNPPRNSLANVDPTATH
jgi:hypothetical protein